MNRLLYKVLFFIILAIVLGLVTIWNWGNFLFIIGVWAIVLLLSPVMYYDILARMKGQEMLMDEFNTFITKKAKKR